MYIQTVALKEVKYFAYHGFYPEEQLIGNHFLVSTEVKFVPGEQEEDIAQTVNYEELNEIVSQEMESTQLLLETVVKHILNRIQKRYPHLIQIKVGIRKLHPIMIGEVGESYVELVYKKDKSF